MIVKTLKLIMYRIYLSSALLNGTLKEFCLGLTNKLNQKAFSVGDNYYGLLFV